MKDIKLLIGSLSNDLYRITNFINKRSYKAAERFQKEAKRWAKELKYLGTYIKIPYLLIKFKLKFN